MKSDYKSFIRKIWRMVDSKEPIDCFYERYKFFLIDLYHAEEIENAKRLKNCTEKAVERFE